MAEALQNKSWVGVRKEEDLKEQLQDSEVVEKLSHFLYDTRMTFKKKEKKNMHFLGGGEKMGLRKKKQRTHTLEYMNTSSSFQWPLNLCVTFYSNT